MRLLNLKSSSNGTQASYAERAFCVAETMQNTENPRIYKLFRIRRIIKDNAACIICIRRRNGRARNYKTNC